MSLSPSRQLHCWFWTSMDWLYPPRCAGCQARGSRWCEECARQARELIPPLCEACGLPCTRAGFCFNCAEARPRFRMARAWAEHHGSLRNAIHRLKYRNDVGLGEELSAFLEKVVLREGWPVDLIVPVPLGRARLRERGYNQAAVLARPLAWRMGLSYQPGALTRVRETPSQVGLNAAERRANLAGAFRGERVGAQGRTILVVDDVMTTGATMDACAQALYAAGAQEVFGVTLARAL